MPDRPVYIVDDQKSIRDLLDTLLLALDYKPFSYAEATSFLEDLPRLRKGIVLLDVRMPDIDGLTVLGEIQRQANNLRVIMMTGHADVPTAVRAMQEGAVDFIEKPFSKEALLGSLERAVNVRQKGTYAPPEMPAIARLSPRERQVLQGIVAGKTNKLIARDLGISHRTVEAHRARLMMKAGADSVADLIRLALRD
jgi:two-component system, LuxR family, response regulator FixJ